MTIKMMFDNALSFCVEKTKQGRNLILTSLHQGDKKTHSSFRYALAKQIVSYLNNTVNSCIKAAYIYGTVLEDRASFTSDIDMIIHINNGKEKLQQAIKKLDKKMLEHYKNFMGDRCEEMGHFLDIHIVNDREIIERKGYGAMVTSIETPPIKIWTREG
ncbi:MAG: hypothetical protein AB1410_07660 [Acidobacteriota bacterium]